MDKIATAIIPRYYDIEHSVQEKLQLKKEKTSIAYDKYVQFVQNRKELFTQKIFGWDIEKTKNDMKNVLDSNNIMGKDDSSNKKEKHPESNQSLSNCYDSNIPAHFRTKLGFDLFVMLPVFFLLLCIQLTITLVVQLMIEPSRSSRGLNKWTPISSVLLTWFSVCIQIYVVYLLAKSKLVAKRCVRRRIALRHKQLNKSMRCISFAIQNLKKQFLSFIKFIISVTTMSDGFMKLIGNDVMNYNNNMIEQEPEVKKEVFPDCSIL